MKNFHSLTNHLGTWHRKQLHRLQIILSQQTDSTQVKSRDLAIASATKTQKGKVQAPLMLLLSVVSLTGVVGYRFYNQPQLAVGTTAPGTIISPSSEEVVDEQATEAKRREARQGVGREPILMLNQEVNNNINRRLKNFFGQVTQVRDLAGAFPFVAPQYLSLPTQRYLRSCTDEEWQAIATVLQLKSPATKNQEAESTNSKNQQIEPLNSAIQQAVAELQNYRQELGEDALKNLVTEIIEIRQGYQKAEERIKNIARESILEDSYLITLLELPDETWQQTKFGITLATKRILTQGISDGLPENLKQQTIQIQLENSVPEQTENIATSLISVLWQTNLVTDEAQMARRADQKARDVQIETIPVQKGEIIVMKGEVISEKQFVLLDHFELSQRRINWVGLLICGGLVTTSVGAFWIIKQRVSPNLRRRDHVLLWLLSLSVPMLAIFKIPYTSLPAIGFLVGSFYHATIAVPFVGLLTGLVTFSSGVVGWEFLLAGAAGGMLAAVMSGRLRSREELALLGGCVGLTQGGFYLLVKLLLSSHPGSILYMVMSEAVFYSLSGLAWSVVALGVSPYLERLFDLVTPIRLAELSNPNRPLLKRLATEAPGTFQHTLFVSSLAEAAARELHCNVELVRAGTLYHDIGKMHDPLGFIENQMGGPNKHDTIDNPWESATIIKKHVSEGLVMARKSGLPKAIRDFIPEHQGTLLISYFYLQAKQRQQQEGGEPVQEADFRYDGPIPQSREAGIMMLADGCEAALRSLKDATPEAALNLVQKIFKARWLDGQLAESGLQKHELKLIGEVFVRVWQQSNHQRIAYPKAALEPGK